MIHKHSIEQQAVLFSSASYENILYLHRGSGVFLAIEQANIAWGKK